MVVQACGAVLDACISTLEREEALVQVAVQQVVQGLVQAVEAAARREAFAKQMQVSTCSTCVLDALATDAVSSA